MAIRVIVNGAKGRMGRVTCRAVDKHPNLELVGSASTKDNIEKMIRSNNADVVIDFTQPDCVYENFLKIINAGARPVIGTSGLSSVQIDQLKQQCDEFKTGAIIAPNFSIGAVLMMRFAKIAGQYYKNAEIIEMHHDNKLDAPSGTAIKTAELMAETLTEIQHNEQAVETLSGARGASKFDIPIHSVRLPGLVAHQLVIFGGQGETLTLRHDSMTRESFMPGVCLACEKVVELHHLIYGLEHLV